MGSTARITSAESTGSPISPVGTQANPPEDSPVGSVVEDVVNDVASMVVLEDADVEEAVVVEDEDPWDSEVVLDIDPLSWKQPAATDVATSNVNDRRRRMFDPGPSKTRRA